jgi:hypothetical protein
VDTTPQMHPAAQGLMDSGLVVAIVRGSSELTMMIVGDQQFVGITMPGSPCDVFLCCPESGALALVKTLTDGLDRLRELRKEDGAVSTA